MTLEEAIEILTAYQERDELYQDLHLRDAVNLGIEALKRHKEMSSLVPTMPYPLLPGETKE